MNRKALGVDLNGRKLLVLDWLHQLEFGLIYFFGVLSALSTLCPSQFIFHFYCLSPVGKKIRHQWIITLIMTPHLTAPLHCAIFSPPYSMMHSPVVSFTFIFLTTRATLSIIILWFSTDYSIVNASPWNSVYSKVFAKFEITGVCGLKLHWYLRTLRTKIKVFLYLPCCFSQLKWDSQKGRARKTSILWNFKLKVLKSPKNYRLHATLILKF